MGKGRLEAFSALWRYAVRHKLTEPDLPPQQLRFTGRRFLIGPASHLAATVIGLFVPTAALLLFIALIIFYLAPGPQHRVLEDDHSDRNQILPPDPPVTRVSPPTR